MQRGEAQSPEKIYFNVAMLALENKDFAAAEDNFRKALEVNVLPCMIHTYPPVRLHKRYTFGYMETELFFRHCCLYCGRPHRAAVYPARSVQTVWRGPFENDDQVSFSESICPNVPFDFQIKADLRSALFNLALLLSEQQRPLESMHFLEILLGHHPFHIKGLLLLGDIYVNYLRDLSSAEEVNI